jgi:hypothetical protein
MYCVEDLILRIYSWIASASSIIEALRTRTKKLRVSIKSIREEKAYSVGVDSFQWVVLSHIILNTDIFTPFGNSRRLGDLNLKVLLYNSELFRAELRIVSRARTVE